MSGNQINRNSQPKTNQTDQYILNLTFDELYQILMVGLAGYNATADRYDRMQIDPTTGGIKVQPNDTFNQQTFSNTGATNTQYLSQDVSAYQSLSLHITGIGTSATVTFQGSNDNATWVSITLNRLSQTVATPATSSTVADLYAGPVQFRYFRVNITGQTAGTTAGTLELYTAGYAPLTIGGQVAVNGTPTVTDVAKNLRATIQASAAQTANGNSATLTTAATYRNAIFTLNCTAVTGTSPTLNVKLQASDDGGTTWYDLVYPGTTTPVAFTQLTAAGTQLLSFFGPFGDTLRAAWVVGGTTPSFTFAVKGVFIT